MRIATAAYYQGQIDNFKQQNYAISQTQLQISSGEKYTNNWQNAIASQKIQAVESHVEHLNAYQENIEKAQDRNQLLDNLSQNALDVMLRSSELLTAAQNETLNNDDRKNIALELEANLQRLVDFANTQDVNGDYIFSGYSTGVKPFQMQNNQYQYFGDQANQLIQTQQHKTMTFADNGFDVFETALTGNQVYQLSVGNNTGTGVISLAGGLAPSDYIEDEYKITFDQNASGDLVYSVTGTNGGQIVPGLPDTIPNDAPLYQAGETVTFNGVSVIMTGTPEMGDEFEVTPSESQSIFNTLNHLIDALKQPVVSETDRAHLRNELTAQATNFDSAYQHFLNYITTIGHRGAELDAEQEFVESTKIEKQALLTSIRDTDYTEAITRLNQQTVALQASQQVYLQLRNLSIFNYL